MNRMGIIAVLIFISLLSIFIVRDITLYAQVLIGTLCIDMVALAIEIKGEIKHTDHGADYQHNNA